MLGRLSLTDYITISVYLIALLWIGIRFSRQQKDTSEYFLGGHRIGWFAAGISYLMTLFSTVSLVQTPGEVFKHGVSLLIPGMVVYPIFLLLSLFFLRIYFERGCFTPFEYLEKRFDRKVRLFVSILYFWTRILYVGMVLFSCVTIFRSIAGWPPFLTLAIVGGAVTFYTVVGGMKAVIWSDVLQAVVLFAGLGLTLWFIVQAVPGGAAEILRFSLSEGKGPVLFSQASFYELHPFVRLSFWLITFQAAMEAVFCNSADQISIQRLLSTSSYQNVKKAMYSNILSSIPLSLILVAIGFSCFTYYSQVETGANPLPDAALFEFIGHKLPSPIPGLIMAAMLAAAMSTLSGSLNSLATVSLRDFFLIFFPPNTFSEERLVSIARQMTIGISFIGMLMAAGLTFTSEALRQTMIESNAIWGFLGVIIAPIFLFAVLNRHITSRMIWDATALAWGLNGVMAIWYVASKSSIFLQDHVGYLAVISLAVVLVAISPINLRQSLAQFMLSLFKGAILGLIVWLCCEMAFGRGELSFQWISWPGQLLFLLVGGWHVLKLRFLPPAAAAET